MDAKKKILFVEDDDELANVYSARLEAEGFDVKRVGNGELALSSAIEYRPDLILLDVMMPKINGFDVLDILRNTPETTNVKIIVLTALSQDDKRQQAQALGADDYLVKSQVVISDVVDRIKSQLGMKTGPLTQAESEPAGASLAQGTKQVSPEQPSEQVTGNVNAPQTGEGAETPLGMKELTEEKDTDHDLPSPSSDQHGPAPQQ